jgi:GMP synthase (glutamine-hydrolysing)
MIVLTVTHGPLVQPELFGDVVVEAGHDLLRWDIRTQGAPPAEGYDAVLVFGGKQNVGEEVEYPWLHEEYEALRRWVDGGTPLLGVCLGAQTLAHALGGVVDRIRPGPLAGFYETELTQAGLEDPVLGILPPRFDAMNANAYRFSLPAGAVELARGPVSQAFRVGTHARGVQFHPEVRRAQAMAWFSAESRELPRPLEEIERELTARLPAWHEHGRALCNAFLQTALELQAI